MIVHDCIPCSPPCWSDNVKKLRVCPLNFAWSIWWIYDIPSSRGSLIDVLISCFILLGYKKDLEKSGKTISCQNMVNDFKKAILLLISVKKIIVTFHFHYHGYISHFFSPYKTKLQYVHVRLLLWFFFIIVLLFYCYK